MEILFTFCVSVTAYGVLLVPGYEPHNEVQCFPTATWLECEDLALAVLDLNTKAAQPVYDIAVCSQFRGEQEKPVRQEVCINTQWPKPPGFY